MPSQPPKQNKPTRQKVYTCPECSKTGFQSLGAVTSHFVARGHRAHCVECRRDFDTARNFIKHREKHLESTAIPVPAPVSVPSKTSGVSVAELPVHPSPTSTPLPAPRQTPKKAQNANTSLRYALTPFRVSTMQGWRPPHDDEMDAQLALAPNFSPIILEPLEQALILRYLRARCHPIGRLHAQGVTFSPEVVASIPPPPLPKVSPSKAADSKVSAGRSRPPKASHSKKETAPTHKGDIAISLFRDTPDPLPIQGYQRCRAIAIDCEMVTVESGFNEVAFLSAVDFLTGEILINNYVKPSKKVVHWNTRSSGITATLMNRAVATRSAILGGWAGARQRLWDFADSNTVLVGHSISNDLNVLGIFHPKIVDSSILTADAVFVTLSAGQRLTRTWALKTLAKELLGYDIQNRKAGHSALEDACATRDVVIWCIRNPEELKAWAEDARQKEEKKEEEREIATQKEREKREKERAELALKLKMAEQVDPPNMSPPWSATPLNGSGETFMSGFAWVNIDADKDT